MVWLILMYVQWIKIFWIIHIWIYRFGRFKTIVLFQTAFAVSATITPFSTDVIMFCVLRFFTGIFGLPSTSTALILRKFISDLSRACFSNYISQKTLWCNYLSMPNVTTFCSKISYLVVLLVVSFNKNSVFCDSGLILYTKPKCKFELECLIPIECLSEH